MKSNISMRLSELEALSTKKNSILSFNIVNNTFSSGYPLYKKLEVKTPLEAVQSMEQIILSKQPKSLLISYAFDNILDLYPTGVKEIFADVGAVRCSNITAGGTVEALINGTSLAHCFLYQCVHCLGCDCIANREKGIHYTDEQFEAMMFDEVKLLTALHHIVSRNNQYKDNQKGGIVYG